MRGLRGRIGQRPEFDPARVTVAIGAMLEELAGELKDKLTVAKVDIDSNPMSPTNYAVRGIPTLILFKDGKPAATQVGALPKGQLKAWINAQL